MLKVLLDDQLRAQRLRENELLDVLHVAEDLDAPALP